jgi:hypothetical protein
VSSTQADEILQDLSSSASASASTSQAAAAQPQPTSISTTNLSTKALKKRRRLLQDDLALSSSPHPYSKSHTRRLKRKAKSALYGAPVGGPTSEVERALLDDVVGQDDLLRKELALTDADKRRQTSRSRREKQVEEERKRQLGSLKIGAESSKKRITQAERRRTLSVQTHQVFPRVKAHSALLSGYKNRSALPQFSRTLPSPQTPSPPSANTPKTHSSSVPNLVFQTIPKSLSPTTILLPKCM